MKYNVKTFYLLLAIKVTECFEPYISGGSFTSHYAYPHTVFLDITCDERCMCGGSILNQNLVLTAAHCLYGCIDGHVAIKYGHEDISKMKSTLMSKYVEHEDYDDSMVINDICLVMAAQKIPLNNNVKRVIVMAYPPIPKFANVAGWGIDETGHTMKTLKQVQVEMRKPGVCSLINEDRSLLHPGAFCAGPITGIGTALNGDSGSALVINESIQVGLVSFKCHQYSLVAYTNVSFYLNWIKKNSKRLFCH